MISGSDIEAQFVCAACGKHAAIRPDFGWELRRQSFRERLPST
jgi:hypothetical protein